MAMEFIERIRKQLGVQSKYAMAKLLGTTPQAYESLIQANDRIRLRDLIALRRVSGLSDKALLDEIEKKVQESEKQALKDMKMRARKQRTKDNEG